MALWKEVFARYGDFHTNLGPHLDSFIRGEDSEVGRRVLAVGEAPRYEPSATVFHSVPVDRLRKGYFPTWLFDKGRSESPRIRLTAGN